MVSFYISNKQKARVVLLWLVFGVFKWAGVDELPEAIHQYPSGPTSGPR
jgi:hypothetical protein